METNLCVMILWGRKMIKYKVKSQYTFSNSLEVKRLITFADVLKLALRHAWVPKYVSLGF